MKKGILLLLLFSSLFAEAQSLKDALFGGKLKGGNNTVVRKGEDLKARADSLAAVDSTLKARADSLRQDSVALGLLLPPDSAALARTAPADSLAMAADTTAQAAAVDAVAEAAPGTRDNKPAAKDDKEVWKEHVDSVTSTLNTEVLSSKKVKKGTYYATVSYTIETSGQVYVNDVFLSPDNTFLKQQIKDRLNLDAPRLTPVLNSAGTPRTVTRKYNFTLSKE